MELEVRRRRRRLDGRTLRQRQTTGGDGGVVCGLQVELVDVQLR